MAQPPTTADVTPAIEEAKVKLTLKSDLPKTASKEEAQAHKNRAMGEARSFALSQLSQAHRAELNELIKAQAKIRGYDWTPAPTAEEKKIAEAEALLKDPAVRNAMRLALGVADTNPA